METDKLDERQDNSAKIYRPINKKKTLKLEITKSEGVSVVLGKHFEFYDADLVESDSTPNSGEVFEILEISKNKYPKDNPDECSQFPYVHISNDRIDGWISGKYVYQIFDEPEKRIELFNKPYFIYKSKNFGVDAIDSTGLVTGCGEFYPILLRPLDGKDFHIIKINENPIYNNYQYGVLYIYDRLVDVSADSTYTTLRIRTEGMEGGKLYDLKLKRIENDHVLGEINNVTNWSY